MSIIDDTTGEILTLEDFASGYLEGKDNHQLAELWLTVKDAIKALYTSADATEGVLLQRMHETGATALPDAHLDIIADSGSPSYMVSNVQAALEQYPEIWDEVFIPEDVKVVPAKIDGRKARSWRNKGGAEIDAAFSGAEEPRVPKLRVKRK